MRTIFIVLSFALVVLLGAFRKEGTGDTRFRKHIRFNHLFVVVDDSTYYHLFDSLPFLSRFSRNREETVKTGTESWTGKYLYGVHNYLELFKPGSLSGKKAGDFGLGFMTNKLGTIHNLQQYWAKTLDSVHTDNQVLTENGKATPWFTSVSIPNPDSLPISAWVMENAREEMQWAGFTEKELSQEIAFSDYLKHARAQMKHVPVDSIKNDILFNQVTALNFHLTAADRAYLRHFLFDIGFAEKPGSFSKDGFTISYTSAASKRSYLSSIHFSLLKKVSNQQHSFRNIAIIADGYKATMNFSYP